MANEQQHAQARVVPGSAGVRRERAQHIERESYSLRELCEAHGICRATVYNLMERGVIATFLLGGRRRISAAEFHALPDRLREAAQSEEAIERALALSTQRAAMGRKGARARLEKLEIEKAAARRREADCAEKPLE